VALSAFAHPDVAPTPETLDAVLGDAAAVWRTIVEQTRTLAGSIDEDWGHRGKSFGWSMRLLQGTRVVAYLTPQANALLLGVVLGEKAIAAREAGPGISSGARTVLEAAPRYAEGRGIRILVASPEDLAVALELIEIKLAGQAARMSTA
jgi:Protein of unknown function (DUF3788)